MDEKGQNSFSEAVLEVVLGIFFGTFISGMILAVPDYSGLFLLVSISMSLGLTIKLLKSEIAYLLGWIGGIVYISQGVSLTFFDILIYLAVPFIGVVLGIIYLYYSNSD